jgi:tetratricopeptide (TPR) repeat protein
MKRGTAHTLASFTLLFGLVACGGDQAADTTEMGEVASPLEGVETPEVVMVLPVTTTSEAAKTAFMDGQYASDVGRFYDARDLFQRAIELDPEFTHAYVNAANSATSLDEFNEYTNMAAEHSGTATEAETILIDINKAFLASDIEGALELSQRLVELVPESPRARLALAGVQATLNRNEDARATMMEAIDLAPDMVAAHLQLGSNYLFNDPKDYTLAEEHMQRAVELAPAEGQPVEMLGDVLRAQQRLEDSREAYGRSAELDPSDGIPTLKRGHINSFLGNYDEARADYDAAIAMGIGGQKAGFANFRAFTHVHAGDPQAAIDELESILAAIDSGEIEIPEHERNGQRINTLSNLVYIALHHDNFPAAEEALARRSEFMMVDAETVGTAEFRRGQEANIAYWDGMLAARRGDFETAAAKADECARLVEPDANPRKMEPVHEMQGVIALEQENWAEAILHLEQGNLTNMYTKYLLALAHEGAGDAEQAQALFKEVAESNFNFVGFALVRQEAMEKLAM